MASLEHVVRDLVGLRDGGRVSTSVLWDGECWLLEFTKSSQSNRKFLEPAGLALFSTLCHAGIEVLSLETLQISQSIQSNICTPLIHKESSHPR